MLHWNLEIRLSEFLVDYFNRKSEFQFRCLEEHQQLAIQDGFTMPKCTAHDVSLAGIVVVNNRISFERICAAFNYRLELLSGSLN